MDSRALVRTLNSRSDGRRLHDVFRNPCFELVSRQRLGVFEALGQPFPPEGMLELGEDPEHVEEGISGRGRSVDRLLDAGQRGALGPEAGDDGLERTDLANRSMRGR